MRVYTYECTQRSLGAIKVCYKLPLILRLPVIGAWALLELGITKVKHVQDKIVIYTKNTFNIGKFWFFLGQRSLQSLKKKFLNDFFFTYFNICFTIFCCILFHQILFNTSRSSFLLWFLYHRLDLRWFQGCPTFTFCLECTLKA